MKTFISILLTILFLSLSVIAQPQPPDTLWMQTYGYGYVYSTHQTSDKGFILGGTALLKTNSLGVLEWEQLIACKSVKQTIDGGYILGGSENLNMHLVKTDPSKEVNTVSHQSSGLDISGSALYILNNFDGFLTAPNPFNESINIKFVLESNERINLSIYNISGQKVAELFDCIGNANKVNSYTFNASDLSSGIYFARLTTPTETKNRKLIYLK